MDHKISFYEVQLINIKKEYPGATSFYFTKPEGYEYTAGQHAKLSVNGVLQDKELTKSMSLTSAPHQGELSFAMHTDTDSVYKEKLCALEPGDTMYISDSLGEFTCDLSAPRYYWIAGGVGITPFMSMLQDMEHRSSEDLEKIALYHIAEENYLFGAYYTKLPITSAQANFQEMEAQLRAHGEHLASSKAPFYVSGSPRFVSGVRKILTTIEVDKERIKLDTFVGYKGLE